MSSQNRPSPKPGPEPIREVVVYSTVATVTDACTFGDRHDVDYVVTKRLTSNGRTRPYDNGYYVEETPLFADLQGRIYHLHPPTDYYGGSAYVRDGDDAVFWSRPAQSHARDLSGRPIAQADARKVTPRGPSLAEARTLGMPVKERTRR